MKIKFRYSCSCWSGCFSL